MTGISESAEFENFIKTARSLLLGGSSPLRFILLLRNMPGTVYTTACRVIHAILLLNYIDDICMNYV